MCPGVKLGRRRRVALLWRCEVKKHTRCSVQVVIWLCVGTRSVRRRRTRRNREMQNRQGEEGVYEKPRFHLTPLLLRLPP